MIAMIVFLHVAMAMIPNSTGDYNILIPGSTETLTTTSPFPPISVTSRELDNVIIYTVYSVVTPTIWHGKPGYTVLRKIYIVITIPRLDNLSQESKNQVERSLLLCEEDLLRRDPLKRRKKRRLQ